MFRNIGASKEESVYFALLLLSVIFGLAALLTLVLLMTSDDESVVTEFEFFCGFAFFGISLMMLAFNYKRRKNLSFKTNS